MTSITSLTLRHFLASAISRSFFGAVARHLLPSMSADAVQGRLGSVLDVRPLTSPCCWRVEWRCTRVDLEMKQCVWPSCIIHLHSWHGVCVFVFILHCSPALLTWSHNAVAENDSPSWCSTSLLTMYSILTRMMIYQLYHLDKDLLCCTYLRLWVSIRESKFARILVLCTPLRSWSGVSRLRRGMRAAAGIVQVVTNLEFVANLGVVQVWKIVRIVWGRICCKVIAVRCEGRVSWTCFSNDIWCSSGTSTFLLHWLKERKIDERKWWCMVTMGNLKQTPWKWSESNIWQCTHRIRYYQLTHTWLDLIWFNLV